MAHPNIIQRSLNVSLDPDFKKFLVQIGAGTLPKTVLIGAILETVSNNNRSTAKKVKEWTMISETFLQGLNH